MLIGNQGVSNSHPLNIPAQNLCTLGIDLITQKEAFSHHAPGNLRGFSAGSGAKVADLLAGLRIQQRNRGHGAGLLQVVDTGFVVRMQTGASLGIVIIAHRLPRNRFFHKRKLRHISF